MRSASSSAELTGPALSWINPAAIGTWLLGFAPVLYLALEGGGYDTVVRSEVGIIAWWIVLLGVVVGVLRFRRVGRSGAIAFGALTLFAVWTALAIGWAESSERGALELARIATYLGVFVLALSAQRKDVARHVVNGVTAAAGIVIALALLSRMHPSWFPSNETAAFLPKTDPRLNYPLNYWNALAAFVALAIPLFLGVASYARSLPAKALAAGALPAAFLALFLTLSRGGTIAAAAGLVVFFVLIPDRLPKLATGLVAACGGGILVAGALQRDELRDGLLNGVARQQGDELLTLTLVVCVGVALVQAGFGLAVRHDLRPRWTRISRGQSLAVLGVSAVVGVVIALAAGAPGAASDGWRDFKDPSLGLKAGKTSELERLGSASGNGRYQFWQSALDANASHRMTGIGPGSFEFWWARNGSRSAFVRDAHSLYLETLAELGVIGFALLAAFMLALLVGGVRNSLTGPSRQRLPRAAATAACASFIVSAGIDWSWEMAVLPVTFLLLAAVVVAKTPKERTAGGRPRLALRAATVVMALAAMVAIALPLAGTSAVRGSQESVTAGKFDPALAQTTTARRVQPEAASPRLQRALVLELRGDYDGAATAARAATARESTNWRNWLVRSRIEAERGRPRASVRAFRKARSLNPRSPVFSQ